MFFVEIKETYGPFCGMGGYGTMTGRCMSKSINKAWKHANKHKTGDMGGGVPVLLEIVIMKNGKIIRHDIS